MRPDEPGATRHYDAFASKYLERLVICFCLLGPADHRTNLYGLADAGAGRPDRPSRGKKALVADALAHRPAGSTFGVTSLPGVNAKTQPAGDQERAGDAEPHQRSDRGKDQGEAEDNQKGAGPETLGPGMRPVRRPTYRTPPRRPEHPFVTGEGPRQFGIPGLEHGLYGSKLLTFPDREPYLVS